MVLGNGAVGLTDDEREDDDGEHEEQRYGERHPVAFQERAVVVVRS